MSQSQTILHRWQDIESFVAEQIWQVALKLTISATGARWSRAKTQKARLPNHLLDKMFNEQRGGALTNCLWGCAAEPGQWPEFGVRLCGHRLFTCSRQFLHANLLGKSIVWSALRMLAIDLHAFIENETRNYGRHIYPDVRSACGLPGHQTAERNDAHLPGDRGPAFNQGDQLPVPLRAHKN